MRRSALPAVLTAVLLVTSPLIAPAQAQSAGGELLVDGDELTLEAGPGQVIRGETDLDAGARVTVRVVSEDPREPFLLTLEGEVGDDGRFDVTADMNGVSPETNLTVSLRHDGTELDEVTGEVVPCSGGCEPRSTDGSDTETPIPTDEPGMADVVQVRQGATAEIPVSLGEEDAVTLVVGDEDVNYRIAGALRDGNDDGRVTVRFHSGAAGDEAPTLSVADSADGVDQVGDETSLDELLDPAAYDLTLYRGENASGETLDIGTLVVTEAGTPSATPETPDGAFDESLSLDPEANQSIAGDADLPTGAEVSVHVESQDPANPFLARPTGTVGEDGRFAVTADLSHLEAGTNVSLELRHDSRVLDRTQETVGDCPDGCENGTETPEPDEETETETDGLTRTAPLDDAGGGDVDIGGAGALAAGGLLAVVGIGLLLGLFRS